MAHVSSCFECLEVIIMQRCHQCCNLGRQAMLFAFRSLNLRAFSRVHGSDGPAARKQKVKFWVFTCQTNDGHLARRSAGLCINFDRLGLF